MSVNIRKVNDDEFEECVNVIRNSFITVANEFGITIENAPTNPAFAGLDSLIKMEEKGIEMFGAYKNDTCVGFVAVEKASEDCFYMERLAVLPKYRHNGYGKELIDFVSNYVKKCGGRKISIGIINENTKLKDWYIKNGFVETSVKVFKHLPFEVCFMEKAV